MIVAGAQEGRLLSSWAMATVGDPSVDWSRDARRAAARAMDLVANDPHAAALVEAVIQGVLGSQGLRLRSLYQADDAPETTDDERITRRAITRCIERYARGTTADVMRLRSRVELEAALLWSEIIHGDCYAVRLWRPGRPQATHATAWRLICPSRVATPPHLLADAADRRIFEGHHMGEDGELVGIWVSPAAARGRIITPGTYTHGRTPEQDGWVYYPVWHQTGIRQVIHHARIRRAGGVRGLTWFAPLLTLAKHLAGTVEAHAVGKRVQACQPIWRKGPAPQQAWQGGSTPVKPQAPLGDRVGKLLEPGTIYDVGVETEIIMPQVAFQGSDLRDFLDTQLRAFTAAWGLPFDFVLAQLTKSNMASSRTALLQLYRTMSILQDHHITGVTSVIDAAILAEDYARGLIPIPTGGSDAIEAMLVGRYQRPPRAMPDPLREAQAALAWWQLRRPLPDIYDEQGWDFEDSMRSWADSVAFMQAQGIPLPSDDAGLIALSVGGQQGDQQQTSGDQTP